MKKHIFSVLIFLFPPFITGKDLIFNGPIKGDLPVEHARDLRKEHIYIDFTPYGNKLFQEKSNLAQGITGFSALDALNEKYECIPVYYYEQKKRLAVFLNLAKSAQEGMSRQELIAAYKMIDGQGKYWNVEDPTQPNKKHSFTKRMWVVVNAKATKNLRALKQFGDLKEGESGIKSIDELNRINQGNIKHILFTGHKIRAILIIEFETPISEKVLSEYQELEEIVRIECDNN